MVTGELPLTTEFSVYMPLSIAAVAVTILNVEPGAYWPWVVRLTRQSFAPHPCPGLGRLLCEAGSPYTTLPARVLGSIPTTEPACPASACCAARCALGS